MDYWEKVRTLLEVYITYHLSGGGDEYVYLKKLPCGMTCFPPKVRRYGCFVDPDDENLVKIFHKKTDDYEEWELFFKVRGIPSEFILTEYKNPANKWIMRCGNGWDAKSRTFHTKEISIDPLNELKVLMADNFYDAVIIGMDSGDATKMEIYKFAKLLLRAEQEVLDEI